MTSTSARGLEDRRAWLALLERLVLTIQACPDVRSAAHVIVEAGLELGFTRARLWLYHEDTIRLYGAAQSGADQIANFEQFDFPLRQSPYAAQAVASRKPIFFHGSELGEWVLERAFGNQGFTPPTGEWVHLPLWTGERCWGILTLDNAMLNYPLPPWQREQLHLFSFLVAGALAQLHLQYQISETAAEQQWLRTITRIATQMQQAHSFEQVAEEIVLGASALTFHRVRLWYLRAEDQKLVGVRQIGNIGLEAFDRIVISLEDTDRLRTLIEQRQPRFFQGQEGHSYLHSQFGTHGYRPAVGEWVGLPLFTENQPVGALMMDNGDLATTLTPAQRSLLELYGHLAAEGLNRARHSYDHEWLDLIQQAIDDLRQATSLERVAEIVVSYGCAFGFERARLWEYSANATALYGLAERGNPDLPAITTIHIPIDESFYRAHMAGERDPRFFFANSAGETFLYRTYGPQGFRAPVGDWVSLPLWSEDRLLGVLTLDNADRARLLHPSQRVLLRLYGHEAAAALERAHLRASERRKRWQDRVAVMAKELQRQLTLQQLADAIVAQSIDQLGFTRARLWLFDDTRQQMTCISQAGTSDVPTLIGLSLVLDEVAYAQHALSSPEPHFFAGRQHLPALVDKRLAKHGFQPPVGDWISLPLWSASAQPLAVLILDMGDRPYQLPNAQIDRYNTIFLGEQIAPALERAHLHSTKTLLETLTRVAEGLQRALTLSGVFRQIMEGAQQLKFERARLYRMLNEEDQITFEGVEEYGHSPDMRFVGERFFLKDSRYLRKVYESDTAVFFHALYEDERDLHDRFDSFGYERPRGEWVGVPIALRERYRWRGILFLDVQTNGLLKPEQRSLIALFASQCAMALERARHYENERHRRFESQSKDRLIRVSAPLQRATTFDELVEAIMHSAIQLGFARARLWQLESDGQTLRGVWELGCGLRNFAQLTMQRSESRYLERTLRGAGFEVFNGSVDGIGFLEQHYSTPIFTPPSGIWVGMRIGIPTVTQWCGVLCLDNANHPRQIRADQFDVIRMFGRQVEAAIESVQRRAQHDTQSSDLELFDKLQGEKSRLELHQLILEATRKLGFQRARLWRIRRDKGWLEGVQTFGHARLEDFSELRVPLIDTPEPIRDHESLLEPTWMAKYGRCEGPLAPISAHYVPATADWAIVPLRIRERCWGVLALDNADLDLPNSDEQLHKLKRFARLASTALERAWLVEQTWIPQEERLTVHLNRVMSSLEHLTRDINNIEQFSQKLVQAAGDLGFRRARLWQVTPDQQIQLISHVGSPELPSDGSCRLALAGETYASQAIAHHQVVLVPQRTAESSNLELRYPTFQPPQGAWIEVPLVVERQCWGLLTLDTITHEEEPLHTGRMAQIELFRRQASALLERLLQQRSLRRTTMIASRIAWAAEVAHDINSRLALIRHYSVIIGRVPSLSFAQLHQLADDHGAALVRQLNDRTDLNALAQALIGDCVTAIDECVDRLHITTEGFEGSLPNRNRAVDQSQHVQIDHWLQQAALQLPRAAGVSLQLAPGAPDAIVQAHPYVLYQVLLHLVRNAYEAIEVGSGSSVVLATRRHAEHVELVISDDGLGVPAELVPHLFEDAFSQKNQYGGMGLLIVRTLVDGMGSSIRYEQSGRGATFILTLRMSVVQTNQGGAD